MIRQLEIAEACLAAEGKIGIFKHEIFSFFILEGNLAISRYPDWSKDSMWIPSQQYTFDNAKMNEMRMQAVFKITAILEGKYKIQV